MDQVKIGRFIAERRRENGLTQLQLAERLGITDRAVSKWENGRAMPDTAIMLDLCGLLRISVNDLLNGEVIDMDEYKEKYEQQLMEMARQKELADKKLLSLEILIGVLSMVILLGACAVAAYVPMWGWLRACIVIAGAATCFVGLLFALKIEQTAGYYECAECGHRYVPTFKSVLWSPHMGRTRHMRCPACNQKSWQKKVLTRE